MLVMAAKRSKSWDQGRRRHVPVHVDHVDRISALPDPIIHQILSLVPTKEAVRTSALSKRWRNLWTSISGLKFLDYSFLGDAINVALNSCLTRHDRNTSLDKFKLDMKYNGGKIRPRMDNWMNIVAKKNVKKLDLTLKPNKNNMVYPLPQAFQYSTSLTTLKLDNLSLETLSSPSLPSLKELVLKKMTNLDDQRLQILLLGSPHLEKMRLDICTELSNPRVSSSSLKFLEITLAYKCEYELVQVEASALESFVLNLMGQGSSCDNVKFSSPASIKNLSLTNAKFGDYWLENLISRSPLLQSLTLDNCCLLRKIKIISGSLKRLYLRETKECDVEMGVIHAPNLASFSYQAYSMMNLSIYAPNLLEVNIVITAETSGKSYNLEWYGNLIDFLSNLDCTETLSMHVCSEKAFIMPAELRKTRHSPLPNLKNLKLKTHSPVFRKRMMKDSLSWVTPTLQTLAMQQEYLHWCYFC